MADLFPFLLQKSNSNDETGTRQDFVKRVCKKSIIWPSVLQNHSAEWNMSTRSSIVWYSISGLTCSQLAPVNFYGLAGSISCSNIGPFNHQMSRKKYRYFWDTWHSNRPKACQSEEQINYSFDPRNKVFDIPKKEQRGKEKERGRQTLH